MKNAFLRIIALPKNKERARRQVTLMNAVIVQRILIIFRLKFSILNEGEKVLFVRLI